MGGKWFHNHPALKIPIIIIIKNISNISQFPMEEEGDLASTQLKMPNYTKTKQHESKKGASLSASNASKVLKYAEEPGR